jgi:hypothetical protein
MTLAFYCSLKETAAGEGGTLFGLVIKPNLAVFQTIMAYLGPRFKLLILVVECPM